MSHLRSRSAYNFAGLAVAAFGLMLPTQAIAAQSVADDPAGHASTSDDGSDDGVAEWPEWATTDGTDGHDMGDVDGHDMGDVDGHDMDDGGGGGHGGHGEPSGPAPERPRALVLGSFAAANAGVLLTAGLMRRRTQGEQRRRRSARAAALRDSSPTRSASQPHDPTHP